jgi:hypothetical protein
MSWTERVGLLAALAVVLFDGGCGQAVVKTAAPPPPLPIGSSPFGAQGALIRSSALGVALRAPAGWELFSLPEVDQATGSIELDGGSGVEGLIVATTFDTAYGVNKSAGLPLAFADAHAGDLRGLVAAALAGASPARNLRKGFVGIDGRRFAFVQWDEPSSASGPAIHHLWWQSALTGQQCSEIEFMVSCPRDVWQQERATLKGIIQGVHLSRPLGVRGTLPAYLQ